MALSIKTKAISMAFKTSQEIFSGLSFDTADSSTLAITGRNGSGKTTLLKIIAGLIRPTEGQIDYFYDGIRIEQSSFSRMIGFVAPYLAMYDNLTVTEHLKFILNSANLPKNQAQIELHLEKWKLSSKAGSQIKTLSSGLVERLRFAMAFVRQPLMLLLDEPLTNLDNDGVSLVTCALSEFIANGGSYIIATNSEYEKQLCKTEIHLGEKLG